MTYEEARPINEELHSHKVNGIWHIVNRPIGKQTIDSN